MQGNITRGALVAFCLCVGIGVAGAKPTAPVVVRVETQPLGGDAYEVTLVVTPTKHVKGLVLELDGRRVAVGAVKAGQTRTMTARVTLGAGAGKNVVGSAVVTVGGGHRRRAAAVARIGAAEVVAPVVVNIVRLPDGTEAAEVRP